MLSETRTFFLFFLRLGASKPEAEDLVQDLFLKLFSHAQHYEARERFAAFAFRVARNAWIDRARRRRGDPGIPQAFSEGEYEVASPPPDPLESLARGEEKQRFEAALHALSEGHRLVVELGVIQELPYSEIASLLGIPVGTVKSRMFHALRRLRAGMGTTAGEALSGGGG